MKLLAADFDKTLFNGDDFKKNIKSINQFTDEGNIFVIVTGRYINHLLSDIKDTNLKYSYLICNDGAIIFDKYLNIVYQKDISNNTACDIADLYKSSPYIDDWYIDTGLIITQDKKYNANGLIGKFNNREKADELLSYIKNKYKDIGGYISTNWINITERSVNKGSAVKMISDLLKINKKDVYTIGDDINDMSMSNYNFNSFRMTNSIPDLINITKRPYNSIYELIEDILKDGNI